MAIDLFGMALSGVVSRGVGKVFDAIISCDHCGQQENTRVGNIQLNQLGCKNCWKETSQFTNACDYTINNTSKEIGHVAALFTGGYSVNRNPSECGWFPPDRTGWLYFYINARAIGMLGKQFVITGKIVDYNSGSIYTQRDVIYNVPYQDTTWYGNHHFALSWHDIPESERYSKPFAIDLIVKSEYGDVLCKDRRLENLWK